MKTYRNDQFTSRSNDCTNIVACQSEECPGTNWSPATEDVLNGLTHLFTRAGVRYFGYL